MPPASMDVTVGESIVLTCQVTHDPSLDIVFTWWFNGRLVDFDRDGDHFERVGGVSTDSGGRDRRSPSLLLSFKHPIAPKSWVLLLDEPIIAPS